MSEKISRLLPEERKQFGLPNEIWLNPIIQMNDNGYGWLDQTVRNTPLDKYLVEILRDSENFPDDHIALFIVSKNGRWLGEMVYDRCEHNTKSIIKHYKEEFRKMVISQAETFREMNLTDDAKLVWNEYFKEIGIFEEKKFEVRVPYKKFNTFE